MAQSSMCYECFTVIEYVCFVELNDECLTCGVVHISNVGSLFMFCGSI